MHFLSCAWQFKHYHFSLLSTYNWFERNLESPAKGKETKARHKPKNISQTHWNICACILVPKRVSLLPNLGQDFRQFSSPNIRKQGNNVNTLWWKSQTHIESHLKQISMTSLTNNYINSALNYLQFIITILSEATVATPCNAIYIATVHYRRITPEAVISLFPSLQCILATYFWVLSLDSSWKCASVAN